MASITVYFAPALFSSDPFNHEYLVYTDDSGNQYFIRGGPSARLGWSYSLDPGTPITVVTGGNGGPGPFGYVLTAQGPYILPSIDYAPPGTEIGQPIIDLPQSTLGPIWASMQLYAASLNSDDIVYALAGPNSNSVITAVLQYAGLPLPQGTSLNGDNPAPGADVPLTATNPSVNPYWLPLVNASNISNEYLQNVITQEGQKINNDFRNALDGVIGGFSALTSYITGNSSTDGVNETPGANGFQSFSISHSAIVGIDNAQFTFNNSYYLTSYSFVNPGVASFVYDYSVLSNTLVDSTENDVNGTSKITNYNPDGSWVRNYYSGPNGTGTLTERDRVGADGKSQISGFGNGGTISVPLGTIGTIISEGSRATIDLGVVGPSGDDLTYQTLVSPPPNFTWEIATEDLTDSDISVDYLLTLPQITSYIGVIGPAPSSLIPGIAYFSNYQSGDSANADVQLTFEPLAGVPSGLMLSPSSDTGPSGDDSTDVRDPVITGTGDVGASLTLYDGTSIVGSGTVGSDGTWSVTTDLLMPGLASLTATETDISGAVSAPSGVLAITVNPPFDLMGNGLSDLLMTNINSNALVLDEVRAGLLTYAQIGGLGPEWQFEGAGAFLGDGNEGELLWNNLTGGMVVAEDNNGAAQYTPIGGVGSEWQFEGNGPLLGQSTDDFMLWNSITGGIVVGAVSAGVAQYTQIGGVGPEWQFEGVGDYLGDGKEGFLIENAHTGALVVGEDVSGAAQYTGIGGLGPEWQFKGTGDFLGHGQDDFLIWNSNTGVLVAGEVTGGAAQYTQIAGLGAEWQFLGTGDYDGQSDAEFMVRNSTTGALVIGALSGSNVAYTAVGGVGPEWNFHTSHVATLA